MFRVKDAKMDFPLLEYSCEENNKKIQEGFYLETNPQEIAYEAEE